jgi:putative transcriptional regulator
MPRLTGSALKAWETGRDLNAELEASIADVQAGHVTSYTVENLLPAARARLKSGMSQTEFAALLGVSKRTLEQWEQGRRKPSGAAKTLIKIAERWPQALKDVAGDP